MEKPIDLKKIYNHIYSIKDPKHPISGVPIELYGEETIRDKYFVEFCNNNIPKDYEILDASCGRGHLIEHLISNGFPDVEGTEISDWVIENELKDRLSVPIYNLSYEQFDHFDDQSFDVVISSDVLEHLESKQHVEQALQHFQRISRRFILVSVGLPLARKWVKILKKRQLYCPINHLHLVILSPQHWKKILSNYINVIDTKVEAGSLYYFGEVA